jgi:TolB protein
MWTAAARPITVLAVLAMAGLPLWPQGSEYPAVTFRSNYLASYYLTHSPTATPWWPAWSPDGKWIAVSLHGSIWKVDPVSGDAVQLTGDRKLHSSPCWSPDGRWIVYTADDDFRSIQLEILNVETGEVSRLTEDSQVYLDPVFSPDGGRLAYVSSQPNGNLNVFTRPIREGRWTGEPLAVTRDHDFGSARLYFSNWDIHIQPAWLPDGRELLLLSNRGIALGSGALWRVPHAEDAMARGRMILDEQTLYRTRPDVSPDGKRLVFCSTSNAGDQFNHLYILPTSGGYPYKMTFGDFDDFHPRWSPDGEQIAHISNHGGLPQLCLLDAHGGRRRTITIRERAWKQPMARLRVRVIDGRTGQPTPARIQGSASDGKLYAPADAFVINARLAEGLERIFYTSGTYTVEVPPGRVVVEAHKGFEYLPAEQTLEAKAGASHTVTLTLKPIADLPAKGWFAATTHTHMNYGGPLRNTPAMLGLMARAQGLHIVSALVANKDNRVLDWQYFRPNGSVDPASDLPGRLMIVFGEEHRPAFWGHTFYIGLREHLISPFASGYKGAALDSLYPSNTDLFRLARAQGAATGYVHAFGGDGDPLAGSLGGAKGFAIDVALRTIDALEWSAASRGSLIPLFHAWNNDFHLAPVGGEDSLANMESQRLPGIIRTYAYLGANFTLEGWVGALKKGNVFLTSGPVVEFSVGGKMPGESLRLPAAGGAVAITGTVRSRTPVTSVRIYRDGTIWKEIQPSGSRDVRFDEQAAVTGSGWFNLVVEAEETRPAPGAYAQAVTNAVRVYAGKQPIRNRASAEYYLQWLEKLRSQVADPAHYRSERERSAVLARIDEAAAVYRKRMEDVQP